MGVSYEGDELHAYPCADSGVENEGRKLRDLGKASDKAGRLTSVD